MVNKAKAINLALGATETTYTDLGDITVPGGVSKIVGIQAIAVIETGTAGEGAIGMVRLTSENVDALNPFEFLCPAFHGPAGTLADQGIQANVPILPVDIDVKEKDVIMVEMKLTIAQTGACEGAVGFLFE